MMINASAGGINHDTAMMALVGDMDVCGEHYNHCHCPNIEGEDLNENIQ